MPLVKDRIVHSPYPDVQIPECTLYNFVAEFLRQYADRTAFIEEEEETMSYAQLLTRLRQYATGFRKHGVKRGDRFIVAVENSTDALVSILALMFSGCVACFASGPRTARELVYHVKDAEASFCLTDNYNLASLTGEESDSLFKRIFVVRDTPGYVSVTSFRGLPEMALEELQEEDTRKALCAIAYTSGTTGEPKGVMLSQYSFVCAIESIRAMRPTGGKNVLIVLWNIYLVCAIRAFMSALCSGSTSVIMNPKVGSKKIMETVKKHKAASLCVSASHLQLLLREALNADETLKSVTYVCSVGSTMPDSAVENMRRVFDLRNLGHVYGLTEAAGVVTAPLSHDTTVSFLGYAHVGVLIKVVDVDTREPLPAGKSGEICVKIPSGYLNKPEATKQVLDSEGWLSTGDCGYYDEEGCVYYVERLKDTIKFRGTHVPSVELEQLIGSMAEVREVAVVGTPSFEYQDATTAFVVPEPPATGSVDLALKIKDYVAAITPIHMHLYGGVVFTDSLPRNYMGKVLKRELRKIAADKDTVKL
ncbi:uncharacterized protein [Dermacentor albipictus]|uniref:uncharacterized protein n=1 Tax=Dermacentor albipictus TaxID=60249 RepID=UPI0031FC5F26